jgi:hypothetical protein
MTYLRIPLLVSLVKYFYDAFIRPVAVARVFVEVVDEVDLVEQRWFSCHRAAWFVRHLVAHCLRGWLVFADIAAGDSSPNWSGKLLAGFQLSRQARKLVRFDWYVILEHKSRGKHRTVAP